MNTICLDQLKSSKTYLFRSANSLRQIDQMKSKQTISKDEIKRAILLEKSLLVVSTGTGDGDGDSDGDGDGDGDGVGDGDGAMYN